MMKGKFPFLRDDEYTRAARFFSEMDHLHMVWARLRPEGIRRSEMGTLGAVAHLSETQNKAVTISMLAKAMKQSVPGISQKVSELENRGYLKRETTTEDRRVVTVELTPQGKTAAEGAVRDFLAQVDKALGQMGQEKSDQLLGLMSELSGAFENVYEEKKGGGAS